MFPTQLLNVPNVIRNSQAWNWLTKQWHRKRHQLSRLTAISFMRNGTQTYIYLFAQLPFIIVVLLPVIDNCLNRITQISYVNFRTAEWTWLVPPTSPPPSLLRMTYSLCVGIVSERATSFIWRTAKRSNKLPSVGRRTNACTAHVPKIVLVDDERKEISRGEKNRWSQTMEQYVAEQWNGNKPFHYRQIALQRSLHRVFVCVCV